jgi:hypothetical protein
MATEWTFDVIGALQTGHFRRESNPRHLRQKVCPQFNVIGFRARVFIRMQQIWHSNSVESIRSPDCDSFARNAVIQKVRQTFNSASLSSSLVYL